MTDNPISDNQKTGGMKPQALNPSQKKQLTAAKTALRKYQAGVAKNAAASAVLAEKIALAVETGITRYRPAAAVKTALRRYKNGVAKNVASSAVLTEKIARAVETGITRYRLAQELGMTHQAVDGRLDRRAKKQQTTWG